MRRRKPGGLKLPLIFCTLALLLSFSLTAFLPRLATPAYADNPCEGQGEDCRVIKIYNNASGTGGTLASTQTLITESNDYTFIAELDGASRQVKITVQSGDGTAVGHISSPKSPYNIKVYASNGTTLLGEHKIREELSASNPSVTETLTLRDPSDGPAPDSTPDASDTGDSSDSESTADTSCSKSAAGLGWILCPVANFLSGTLSTFFSWMEQFLQINPYIFSDHEAGDGSTTGMHTAWSVFRDLANVFFVIYILIMIISQVTGAGISNYGIKKNLPRIIVAAILVNVSFYLCILAVDLSNIIGASVKGLFDTFASNIEVADTGIYGGITSMRSALHFAGVGVLAAAGVGYLISVAAGGGALLIANGILMGILTVLLATTTAIVGMFIVLAVRQGLIVICVVVAPLAIIFYTLPNTKQLFDRWWKISKSLIIMYPLCGFVIGAGTLASRVLLSTGDDFWTILIAAIVQVGPYFALPSLVRGSVNAVGNLGNRIGKFAAHANQRAWTAVPPLRRLNMSYTARKRAYEQNRDYKSNQKLDTQLQAVARRQRERDAKSTIRYFRGADPVNDLSPEEQDLLTRAHQELATQKSLKERLAKTADMDYWAQRQKGMDRAMEKREQEENEQALMQDYKDQYRGEVGYQEMQKQLKDILAGVRQDSNGNLVYADSKDERKASALMRILLETPGQDKKVFSMIHGRYSYDSHGNLIQNKNALSDEGLKALNEIRMSNTAVGAKFGQKAKITSAYLDSIVGDDNKIKRTDLEISKDYSKVLTSPSDYEEQSSSELRAYADGFDKTTAETALNSQLFTDADKRQIVENAIRGSISDSSASSTFRQQMDSYNTVHEQFDRQLTVQIQNTALSSNGTFDIPTGYTQMSSGKLNRPDAPDIVRMKDSNGEEYLMNLKSGVVESKRRFVAKDQASGNDVVATGFRMPEGHRLRNQNNGTSGMIDKGTMKYDLNANVTRFKYKDDASGQLIDAAFNHETGEFKF